MRDVSPIASPRSRRRTSTASAATRPHPGPAPFPQPSPLFIGHKDELGRCRRLLEQSPLLLVYGVPGIGKTEFVYRLVADLLATRSWRRTQPIFLRAQAGQRIEQLVAQLGDLLAQRSPEEPARPPGDLHAELAAVARGLTQAARLIFIDDVHHLDPAAVGEAASYLARRSGGSRLFIASRRELPLLTDAVPPTIVRLPPLSAAETTELALRLAELQGLGAPDAQAVFSRTGGSPRLLHRLVRKSAETDGGDEDALAQTLQALRPAARRLLVLARILAGKLPASEWLKGAGGLLAEQPELATLTHYHLVDLTRATVPDPVWNTLLTLIGARELRSAHRLAAQLHLRRCAGAPVGSAAAAAALAAVQHQVAAGEPLAAWATFQLWAYTFCATELGSAALALLPTLLAELPGQRVAIELLTIRLLLSQGQLEPAQVLLAESESTAGRTEAVRWQLLAGQVAQRGGQLSRAGAHFRAAQATAATPHERFLAAVHRAELAALRGAATEAESILASIRQDAPGSVTLSPAE
ncbi:MAG TPA: ATP-binding protein, partial [Pseudomonadota bacterium]|nr:ATP-binding protein [Pseudomonadota bacterium]